MTFTANAPLRIPEYRPYPGSNRGDRELSKVERSLWLNTVGLYIEGEWTPGRGPVTLTPGVRTDLHRYFEQNRSSVDPRLNARWQPTETLALKAGVGLFSQPPPERRLDKELGNPDLAMEWAVHYGLGFEVQLTSALSVDVQGFFAPRRDLAQRSSEVTVSSRESDSPLTGTDVDVDVERFASTGRGRTYGIEILAKHEVTHRFYGWVSYTLGRSEGRANDNRTTRVSRYDQTHNLVIVASYKLGAGWETGLRFRLVSGNPTTRVEEGTFDGDWGQYRRLVDEWRTERQDAFNQLDLRAEKTWVFDRWRLSAFLDIQNVYNATNAELTTYDYRFEESAPVPGIPFLPSIGLMGRF